MANQVLEIQLPENFEVFTDKVIERGWVGEIGKNRRDITGAISKMEARTLAKIILKHNCQRSFETGVANGISTLELHKRLRRIMVTIMESILVNL